MKKKRFTKEDFMFTKTQTIVLVILFALTFALYIVKNNYMEKIYEERLAEREAYYMENTENIPEAAVEKISENEGITVYITTNGEKYHKNNCMYLRFTKKEIDLDKAKRLGYTPCTVCGS